jgi:hypothetical protein
VSQDLPVKGLLALLVHEGLLSAAAAAKHATDRGSWIPLGTILVRSGHLTIEDLAILLEMQTDECHLRIGELAVREGYCTPEDVEKALVAQTVLVDPPVQTLLSAIRGDRERLCRILLRYVGQLEARLVALHAGAGAGPLE